MSKLRKLGSMAKDKAKQTAKNKASKAVKNTKAYKAMDKAQQSLAKAKKMAQMAGRAVRFVMFIVSNPIGWVCGILLGVILYNSADALKGMGNMGGDLTRDTYHGNRNRIGNQSQNDTLSAEGNIVLIDCKHGDEGEKSTSDSVASGNASESDWTKEGTRAHTNAKKTFESWTSKGLSGTAAAGIVGWVESEGGFYMVGRAEGRQSNVLEESSLKFGAVPLVSGQGYSVGGGGIYQFTPYTKYAPLSDPAWEDIDKMTAFVVKSLPSDWNPGHDLSGKNQSLEQFAKQTDIADATLAWNAYEKGDPRYIPKDKKVKDGQKANEIFNKDNIKFDEAKFNENFGKSSGGGSSSSSGESAEDSKTRCKNTKSKGGGKGWYKHKDGKADPSVGAWTKESLPDGLKPYALDPESLGMKFSSKDGWECLAYVGNQCTDLTASLAYKLWEKDGKHPKQARGNGVNVADNWAATFGGDVSHEPKAGSIFSNAEGSEYGHTGIVSHVFEDGSILIIEQNYAGKSGAAVGQTFTWNYRMVSASDAAKWKFYDPETQGYSIVEDAKAVG